MGRAVTELSTHTFELDLTSVCVSSGTLQLPLKMQQFFTPGRVPAVVDGQALELEFHAPRRLAGLREHFAERGLRSNDRVRFELEAEGGHVVGLRLTCVRRERPKAPEGPAAGEQVKAAHVRPVGGSWESGGGVRVVTKVRIPGLSASPGPAELVAASEPATEVDPGGAAVSSSHAAAREGRSAVQEQEVFDDGITTVRAVRRRPAASEASRTAPVEERPVPAATGGPAQDQVVRPIVGSTAFQARVARPNPPLQLSDLIAPPIDDVGGDAASRRSRRWVLPPRLRAAGQTAQRQPHTSGPSRGREEPVVADRESPGGEGREHSPRRQEARDATDERGGEPHPRAPRAEAARNARPEGVVEARELIGAVVQQAPVAGPTARATPADGGNGDANVNPFRAALGYADVSRRSQQQAPAGPRRDPVEPAGVTPAPVPDAADPRGRDQDLGHTLLIDDADFGGEYLDQGEESRRAVEAAPGSLEGDVALVRQYLSSPGTPAIVRSEAVGELLGIGDARAERALERISEEPESVSRIRRGAYMVRRRPD